MSGLPMLKAISGHTSTKGIRRYLTKKNRALAEDCLNLDPPEPGRAFDWAAAMDETWAKIILSSTLILAPIFCN